MNNPWFVKVNADVDAPVRIICLPSSGGGANMYRNWEGNLDNVEIYSVQLPGRERRLSEAPIDNIDALVEALVPEVEKLNDKPLLIFGHSMGALIAYELCCALQRKGSKMPKAVFVSAFRTPERINRNKKLHPLAFDDFIEELKKYGGTPEEILNHRETMELFVPTIRADFKIHETYVFPNHPQLTIPIISFSGTRDHVVPGSHMIGWNNHTSAEYAHHTIEGGHFFIHDNQARVLMVIQDKVNECMADELFAAL